MQNLPSNRGVRLFGLSALMLIALGCACAVPASAQNTNNPPHITSEPSATVAAGDPYAYQLEATDQDNDTVTFSLTAAPKGMVISNGVISWNPTAVGVYNVVIDATDGNEGYDTQAWHVTVQPSVVSLLKIIPNERPTVIEIGATQKFTATAYDAYDNELSGATIAWTTDEKTGVVDTDGTFSARKGGIGFIAASIGETSTSIGIVVKDTRTEQVTPAANANTNTNAGQAASTETTNTAAQQTVTNTNSALPQTTTDTDGPRVPLLAVDTGVGIETACKYWSMGTLLLSLAIYLIGLGAYYTFTKNRRFPFWWIFPIVFTGVGVTLYYRLLCTDATVWWPWVLIAFGILLTWYHKFGGRAVSQSSQTELPF
ncbi:MAG: putative Ig domain-containing protein [Patescibacteria group bacterium]|nr:putative Ig domain-containing protein [Patescibacteria group bacterium]MDD5715253.1 putative Ig domain-containing protein [Patescibacteria group bacterium]